MGDRVVVPFPIACGSCFSCQSKMFSLCENSNPNAWMAEKMWGHATAGMFGYSHMLGGFAGGQAEYARVPFADVGPIKVPEGMPDEQVLFLSDIFPTGYMARGEVRHPARRHHRGLGLRAGRPVRHQERLPAGRRARDRASTAFRTGCAWRARRPAPRPINYEETSDIYEALKEMTGGPRPGRLHRRRRYGGACAWPDRTPTIALKQAIMMETDRPIALRQAIMACRNGGTVSVIGVYGGFIDKFPMGSFMNRSLTMKTGQSHVQRYLQPLLERIQKGEIDPSFVITHHMRSGQRRRRRMPCSATSRTTATRSS